VETEFSPAVAERTCLSVYAGVSSVILCVHVCDWHSMCVCLFVCVCFTVFMSPSCTVLEVYF